MQSKILKNIRQGKKEHYWINNEKDTISKKLAIMIGKKNHVKVRA